MGEWSVEFSEISLIKKRKVGPQAGDSAIMWLSIDFLAKGKRRKKKKRGLE